MTRTFLIAAATAGLMGAQAMAQDAPQIEDTDGNGTWSLAELQVAYPALTEETFTTIDANADGGVDPAELSAAVADGAVSASQ